jgi:hypothetical protein
VKSPTWIPVAYTWTLPGSKWRQMAIESMARSQILMAGPLRSLEISGDRRVHPRRPSCGVNPAGSWRSADK